MVQTAPNEHVLAWHGRLVHKDDRSLPSVGEARHSVAWRECHPWLSDTRTLGDDRALGMTVPTVAT